MYIPSRKHNMVLLVVLICALFSTSAFAGGRGGHNTTFDPNLFPGAATYCLTAVVSGKCSTGFNATCDGAANDTAAYKSFLATATALTTQVVLYIPPGSRCRIVYDGTFTSNVLGSITSGTAIKNFVQWGYGASIDLYLSFGFTGSSARTGLIQSTTPGDTSVTLITAGDASNYIVGDWVCVCGLELQHGGFPPNFQFYEFRMITAINGGLVSLSSALSNQYLSTWPTSDPKDGPAAIWPMVSAWNAIAAIYGINVVETGGQINVNGRTVTLQDVTIPRVKNVAFSANQTISAFFTDLGSPEVDKIIERAILYRSTASVITIQSPAPTQMEFVSSSVSTSLNGTPGNIAIINSRIPVVAPGPVGYGHGQSIVSDGTYFGAAQQNTTNILLFDLTLTTGVLSIAKTNPNRFNLLAIGVPGQKYYYGAADCTNNSIPATVFSITAMREDVSNFYADTDILGSPAPTCGGVACTKICPYAAALITQKNSPAGSANITTFAAP